MRLKQKLGSTYHLDAMQEHFLKNIHADSSSVSGFIPTIAIALTLGKGSYTNSKFKIQNSKLRIQTGQGFRAAYLSHSFFKLVLQGNSEVKQTLLPEKPKILPHPNPHAT
jgi:hypothetical protein